MYKWLGLLLFLIWTGPVLSDDGVYYASLRKNEVNWRSGPGEKYPIKWIYKEPGYPVKVLDKYDIWRQVSEVDGTIGWVHKNMLSDRRTVLVQEEGTLTNKPDETASTIAVVQPGTVARIQRCPIESKYCLLSFRYEGKDIKGWFPKLYVWGVEPDEDID